MNILVKDEEGLGMALMMDGFSQTQIAEAKRAISKSFSETAKTVFSNILGLPDADLPKEIIVNMAQDNGLSLASFHARTSTCDCLVFYIRELTVKCFLTGVDVELFRATVIHEMIHAADLPMLEYYNNILDKILNNSQQYNFNYFGYTKEDPDMALFSLLSMLGRFRAEGIALLGEHLLNEQAFDYVDNPLELFQWALENTLYRSSLIAIGENTQVCIDENVINESAYYSAPVVILNVLFNLKRIKKELFEKAKSGLMSGDYKLSREDAFAIVKISLSLSVSEFIQGVLTMENFDSPTKMLLVLCGELQDYLDGNNIKEFIALIHSADSVKTYNDSIRAIMGTVIPVKELQQLCNDFKSRPINPKAYPQLQEKVMELYSVLKYQSDPKKVKIAQCALTYFFNKKDLIYDDLSGIGLVDDMLVVDKALELCQ